MSMLVALENAGRLSARQEIFELQVQGRKVPAVLWTPFADGAPRPLVLVGHGGSGHKLSDLVLDIAKPMLERHKIAVAAIDGPVHGERRAVFDAGIGVRQEFRDLWSSGESVDPMIADWRALIDRLQGHPGVDGGSIAWYGISMGTAYGLPLVAAEPRIRAAVLGMWGTSRQPSERLSFDAQKIDVPVLFQRQAEDPFFSVAGQEELFGQLASNCKRLTVHPGKHNDPTGVQLEEAVTFLASQLLR